VLGIIVQLMFLKCILSIDNAAVMGAMVAHLPTDQATPWPASLRPVCGWADRLLGPQRPAALKVSLVDAYVGCVMLPDEVPFVQLAAKR
jgi:tellurite resistance protein TerC